MAESPLAAAEPTADTPPWIDPPPETVENASPKAPSTLALVLAPLVPPVAVAVAPPPATVSSPAAFAHRHPHDTYAVITPVSSPKRSSVSTAAPVPPESAPPPPGSPRSRPHLNLNLSAVGVTRPTSTRSLVPSSNGRVRKVTRDIAALDFLQNIPMLSECSHLSEHSRKLGPLSSPDHDAASPEFALEADDMEPSLAGRRLPGPDATVVNVLPLFRYRLTTKYPAASAVVRRWEATMTEKGVLDGRIFLSSGKGYPVGVSSVIKYNGTEKVTRGRKRLQSVMLNPEPYDWRGKSYFRLLHATWSRCDKDRDAQDSHPTVPLYDPNFLDNPEYRQGRHKDVIRGDRKVGPIVSSILRFVKPHDLKEELNKQFRETHAWLADAELSLSKIRNLKQEALAMAQRTLLDISTVALACVYFEKLVLSNLVHKGNRKLYMSACLILALKFNEPLNRDGIVGVVKKLLVEIDHVHSLPSRDVLTAEFTVYAQLSFALHVPLREIQPHFARLLRMVESNPRQYLGEATFALYSALLHDEQSAVTADDDDEDDDGGADGTDLEEAEDDDVRDQAPLFPWNRVSFAQWWKDRT
ncbi:hypothetical protein ACHHYP_14744 [Achlya hypogyna]|uniref:Cyclin N-terminal domain-containing protein n=1 Tax=Achlya hypogyna TaxID=1202772 RepID=A0A1V9YCK1_ACHHY|nr:hypothetical protein ACHHYP_14744 [Achlya hypogyna]